MNSYLIVFLLFSYSIMIGQNDSCSAELKSRLVTINWNNIEISIPANSDTVSSRTTKGLKSLMITNINKEMPFGVLITESDSLSERHFKEKRLTKRKRKTHIKIGDKKYIAHKTQFTLTTLYENKIYNKSVLILTTTTKPETFCEIRAILKTLKFVD